MARIATQSEIANSDNNELSSGYAFTPQTEFEFTPYPSMTLSQRLELNKILHTNDITNNNVSTFSEQDIIEPEPVEQEQEKVMGCCVVM